MSLWDSIRDTAKEIGKATVDAAKERREEVDRYKERYADAPDEALLKAYRNSSGSKRYACAILLKERGYGSHTE